MDADGENARALTQQRDRRDRRRSSRRTTRRCCSSPTRTSGSSRTTTDRPVRRAGGRRHAARGAARLSVRDRARDVGARRPLDPRRRQHGRPQRALPDRRRVGRTRQLTDGAHFIPPWLDGDRPERRARSCSSSTSRRGSATSGRCRRRRATPTRVTGVYDRARARLQPAAAGKDRVEGRRRRHDRGAALLSDRLSAGHAVSAGRAAARRAARIRQVRRRPGPGR